MYQFIHATIVIQTYTLLEMEETGDRVIEQLRKRVQQDAQRRSEKIKDGTFVMIGKNSNNQNQSQTKIKNNIFANMQKPQQNNLFSKDRKSVNLFQIKPRSSQTVQNGGQQDAKNIFMASQKPSVEPEDSNDEKEGSQDDEVMNQTQHAFRSDPEVKQMKYSYQTELCKKLQMPLKKFKNGISLPREEVYVTLETLPNQPSNLYLNIRANTTKVVVYQATMIKNISKPENFMDKLDNLKFDVFKKKPSTEEQNQNKLLKEVVKLQFFSAQNSAEFKKIVEECFGADK